MIKRRIFAINVVLAGASVAAAQQVLAMSHAGAPGDGALTPAAPKPPASSAKPAAKASAPKSAASAPKDAAAANMVDEKDANAVGLGYKKKSVKADQKCGSCALYNGKEKAAAGACPLFPGKQVSAEAWCTAYAKKASTAY